MASEAAKLIKRSREYIAAYEAEIKLLNEKRYSRDIMNALYDEYSLPLTSKERYFKSTLDKQRGVIAELRNRITSEQTRIGNLIARHGRNPTIVNVPQPKFVDSRELDRIGPLYRVRYTYDNINSIRGLYEAILNQIDANDAMQNKIDYFREAPFTIGVIYQYLHDNKITARSIKENSNLTFEEFARELENFELDPQHGSDPIGLKGDFELNLNQFMLTYYYTGGDGKSEDIIFENENINSEAGLCGYECLKACGFEYEGNPKDLRDLETLINVIHKNKLPIKVISNTIDIMQDVLKTKFRNNYNKKDVVINGRAYKTLDMDDLAYHKKQPKPEYSFHLVNIYDGSRRYKDKNRIYDDEDSYENLSEKDKRKRDEEMEQLRGEIETKKYEESLKEESEWIEKLRADFYCLNGYYPEKDIVIEENKTFEYNKIIIYDSENKHFDIAKTEEITYYEIVLGIKTLVIEHIPILKKGIQCTSGGAVIFNNRKLAERKKIYNDIGKVRLDTHPTNVKYIFFDYETVIDMDKTHCMQEYSLSINVCSIVDMAAFSEADKENNEKDLTDLRKSSCKTFKGYDCSEQFIKWLIRKQQNNIFVLIGYNNANFDNLILLNAFLNYRLYNPDEISITNEQYNGNQLLNFVINGRHTLFDLRKHLVMGNLAGLCREFGLKLAAKKKFDHSHAQRLFNMSVAEKKQGAQDDYLLKFINNNEELQEYNEFDVISIAIIYFRYRKALKEINICEKYAYKLYESPTIGSLIWKLFKDNQEREGLKFPKLEYTQYKDILKYKIAGRVEMFNGKLELSERICSMDVCSLYPYMMAVAPNYYPTGENITEVAGYMGDDELGFYYCDFDQSELRAKNLPNIYAEKLPLENNWNHTGEVKGYLISNVMIRLLKKFNCKITIHNGFIFEDYQKGFKVFKFLAEFMQAKNMQDTYKKTKDPKYNGVLREVFKLLLNNMSGKIIESLHNEKVKAINGEAEYLKIKKTAEKINFINAIGDRVYCSYTINEEDLIKQQRPVYIGVLIYDYSKEFMYTHAYSKIGLKNLVYTDTDSCKFPHRYLEEWKKYASNVIVPHWEEIEEYDPRFKTHKLYEPNSKVFGSYEDEYKDKVGNDYYFVCVEKKSYLYKAGEEVDFKFKGISPNSIPLYGNEPIIEPDKVELINDYKKVYEFYEANKSTDKARFINFFKEIYNTGSAIILTSSFRRIVKNGLRDVELNDDSRANKLMNHIQVNFTIKQINLNRKQEEKTKKEIIAFKRDFK